MPTTPTAPSIRSVGLVFNAERSGSESFTETLSIWLRDQGLAVYTARNIAAYNPENPDPFDRLISESDLVVVLGGDGSLLGAARRAAPAGKPILGIHWGGLGFLNECQPDQAQSAIERTLRGDYLIEERFLLLAELRRNDVCCSHCPALNDVAVTRDTLSRILSVEVSLGDEPAASFQGDGIVIATPTGSTGHSLSAGGPILDPRVDVLAVTPICPHALGGRTLVVPASERLTIRHSSPLANVVVTLDGQVGMPMDAGDILEVTRAPWRARFVRFGTRRFYPVLRDKMHWRL
ncbi:MAG TPA: NAD(+)/NADH kinase [Armatimonadota bacterium]|nr:NAD(+)/NADH kinase [Armatimonadota bacterium]